MTGAQFFLTNKQVLTSGLDGTVRFWDCMNGQRKHTIDTIEKCYSFHMNQNETEIVTGLPDSIKVFDARTRALEFKLEDAHSSNVTCIKYTPDENYIVSTSSDSLVKVWDVRERTILKTYEHDCMQCSKNTRFGISPNSQYVTVGTKQGHMVYLNLHETHSRPEECIKQKHQGPIVDVQW